MYLKIVIGAFVAFAFSAHCFAQDASSCGSPPSPNVMKDISEKTKGDIEGKAQAISKVLGSADLGGKIETERRTLYQTTDQSEALRNDRYLFYVTCVLLMKDTTTPLTDKLDALRKLRAPIPSTPAGPSKSELMQNFLAEFQKDVTPEKIKAMLGVPDYRSKIDIGKAHYTLEQYNGEYADVMIVGINPVRAIAVYARSTDQPRGVAPVPYYVVSDDSSASHFFGLGDFTLADFKESCDGKLGLPDARFFYMTTPPCFFGRGGGYNTFIFRFDAGEAVSSCGNDPFSLQGKNFSQVNCASFWQTKPNLSLTYILADNDQVDAGKAADNMMTAIINAAYLR